jgi:prepilin-type N-terminal cleavage/methylation domain-containing protein
MKNTNKKNGFTLIELIIVMVILGIMAAVAVPRYLDSISNAEQSAEDAVISAIRSGLKQAANDSLYTNGRATWPTNPFDALSEKPSGYSTNDTDAAVDGEWTFSDGRITHQRADNSRYSWDYYAGVQNGDEAETGTLDGRTIIEQESEEN